MKEKEIVQKLKKLDSQFIHLYSILNDSKYLNNKSLINKKEFDKYEKELLIEQNRICEKMCKVSIGDDISFEERVYRIKRIDYRHCDQSVNLVLNCLMKSQKIDAPIYLEIGYKSGFKIFKKNNKYKV